MGILPYGLIHTVLNVGSTNPQNQKWSDLLLHHFYLAKQKELLLRSMLHEVLRTMPNGKCWGTSWGMLEYNRWCRLTEKGQTDIVTHLTNIWNKYLKYLQHQKDFFPQNVEVIEIVVSLWKWLMLYQGKLLRSLHSYLTYRCHIHNLSFSLQLENSPMTSSVCS